MNPSGVTGGLVPALNFMVEVGLKWCRGFFKSVAVSKDGVPVMQCNTPGKHVRWRTPGRTVVRA